MRGLSPETQKGLLLSVGSHRAERPLSPLEAAQALQASVGAGSSLQDLAQALHLDGTSMLSRFLRLLQLSPDIQHLIDWGQSGSTIAFTAASELSRLPTQEDQTRVCLAVLENQLSSSEVKQLVQSRLRSKQPIEECIAAILRLRPHIERRHLFVGGVTSEILRAKLSSIPQIRRDDLFRQVLRQRFPELREFASRLGIERFTITGGDSVAAALKAGEEDFETAVNAALLQATAEA